MNHSMAVGACALKIAEQAGSKEMADHALIAGLMHDVGKLVLADSMGEKYNQVLALVKEENISIQESEFKIYNKLQNLKILNHKKLHHIHNLDYTPLHSP